MIIKEHKYGALRFEQKLLTDFSNFVANTIFDLAESGKMKLPVTWHLDAKEMSLVVQPYVESASDRFVNVITKEHYDAKIYPKCQELRKQKAQG